MIIHICDSMCGLVKLTFKRQGHYEMLHSALELDILERTRQW